MAVRGDLKRILWSESGFVRAGQPGLVEELGLINRKKNPDTLPAHFGVFSSKCFIGLRSYICAHTSRGERGFGGDTEIVHPGLIVSRISFSGCNPTGVGVG